MIYLKIIYFIEYICHLNIFYHSFNWTIYQWNRSKEFMADLDALKMIPKYHFTLDVSFAGANYSGIGKLLLQNRYKLSDLDYVTYYAGKSETLSLSKLLK